MVVNDTNKKKCFVLFIFCFCSIYVLIYVKIVCKPVSVLCSYLSRINITINFKQPTQTKIGVIQSLFGFAPGGVYLAIYVTINAVRSYRTFSPLLTNQRYIFCGTFPKVAFAGCYPAPLLLETGLSSLQNKCKAAARLSSLYSI